VSCARLSWPFRQLLSARRYIVSYRIVSSLQGVGWHRSSGCSQLTERAKASGRGPDDMGRPTYADVRIQVNTKIAK